MNALNDDARAAADGIREDAKGWIDPPQKPLIVLDPGHGTFYLDYDDLKNSFVPVEVEHKKRVGKRWKHYTTTGLQTRLQELRGTKIMWPKDGGGYREVIYNGTDHFPAGTYRRDPGTQVQQSHYKGEVLVAQDGTEYVYDGKSVIARGTWVKMLAEHVTSKTPHRSFTVSEEDITLDVAKRLKTKLEMLGFDVELTREKPDQILASRYNARIVQGQGRKVMHISVHVDNNPDHQHGGLIGYYSDKLSPDMAAPSAALARALGDAGRDSIPWDRTAMLNPELMGAEIPAAVIETGNLHDKKDLKRLTSLSGQDQTAELIAERIQNYYKNHATLLQTLHSPPMQAAKVSTALLRPSQPPRTDSIPLKKPGLER